jgi:hypothetical protein
MSAHDRLSKQLRASVRERRTRRRAGRGLLMSLAGVAVIGGGVATAATGVLPIAHHDDHRLSARQVAFRTVEETQGDPACRRFPAGAGARTTPVAPAPAARRLLGGSPSPGALRRAIAFNHGGPIVAGSARRIALPDGGSVVLWLAVGDGSRALVDPAACGRARWARLARDLPDPASRLRRKAAVVLSSYSDTRPAVQTLWILHHVSGARSWGGGGIPLDGRPLPIGVVAGGSGTYVGLAAPGAVRVDLTGRTVQSRVTRDIRGLRAIHRHVPVRHGVFVVALPRGTGPVRLRQRSADGRVLAGETLRG